MAGHLGQTNKSIPGDRGLSWGGRHLEPEPIAGVGKQMEGAKFLDHLLVPEPQVGGWLNNAWVPSWVPRSPPGERASRTLDAPDWTVRGTITEVLAWRGKPWIPLLGKSLQKSQPRAQGGENNAWGPSGGLGRLWRRGRPELLTPQLRGAPHLSLSKEPRSGRALPGAAAADWAR